MTESLILLIQLKLPNECCHHRLFSRLFRVGDRFFVGFCTCFFSPVVHQFVSPELVTPFRRALVTESDGKGRKDWRFL